MKIRDASAIRQSLDRANSRYAQLLAHYTSFAAAAKLAVPPSANI